MMLTTTRDSIIGDTDSGERLHEGTSLVVEEVYGQSTKLRLAGGQRTFWQTNQWVADNTEEVK